MKKVYPEFRLKEYAESLSQESKGSKNKNVHK